MIIKRREQKQCVCVWLCQKRSNMGCNLRKYINFPNLVQVNYMQSKTPYLVPRLDSKDISLIKLSVFSFAQSAQKRAEIYRNT